MDSSSHFNIPAYLVSGAAYFFIGYAWFALLFEKAWEKAAGHEMKASALPLIANVGAAFLYAFGVYMIVMLGKFGDVKGALIATGCIAAFFVLPINLGTWIWKRKPVLFFIEASYQTVGALVMSLILALWK